MNRGVKLKSNAKLAQSVKHPKPTTLQVDNSCQDKHSSIYLSNAELFKLPSLQVSLKTSTFFILGALNGRVGSGFSCV